MYLEPESEKRAKNVYFHTAKKKKKSKYNRHFFAILDEFLETDLRPIYCSLTCQLKKKKKQVQLSSWSLSVRYVQYCGSVKAQKSGQKIHGDLMWGVGRS